MTRPLWARCLAEGAGTAWLVGIGTGAIVAGAGVGGIPQWMLALAWFAAVAVPVWLFASISGAHLNPTVTLSLAAAGRFPPSETLAYGAAQVGGGLGGSLAVLGLLGPRAHLGATVPLAGAWPLALGLELAFTALLVLGVLWLSVLNKERPGVELLLPATVVAVSTYLIGPYSGSSLNPARTLAPALLSGSFQGWWIYLVAVPVAIVAIIALVRRSAPRVPIRSDAPGPARPS